MTTHSRGAARPVSSSLSALVVSVSVLASACTWSPKQAGIGVQLDGALARAAERLQPTVTIWSQPDFGDGCRLAVTTALRSTRAGHDTLLALTSVLAHRPDMRARLADPHTVGRLAADLAAGMRERPDDHVPTFSVGDLDVALALYRCGLVFEHGRPLPGEVVEPDEARQRVHATLDTMPLRGRRRPDPATIERVVRRRYLDVEPWPFAALLDGR